MMRITILNLSFKTYIGIMSISDNITEVTVSKDGYTAVLFGQIKSQILYDALTEKVNNFYKERFKELEEQENKKRIEAKKMELKNAIDKTTRELASLEKILNYAVGNSNPSRDFNKFGFEANKLVIGADLLI